MKNLCNDCLIKEDCKFWKEHPEIEHYVDFCIDYKNKDEKQYKI